MNSMSLEDRSSMSLEDKSSMSLKDMSSMSLEDAIRQSYLFHGAPESDVEKVYEIASLEHHAAQSVILEQFSRDTDLHILASGSAQVVAVGETIGVVKAGMPIGEVSFFDGRPRSLSVVTDGGCTTVLLPADRLRSVLAANPEVELLFLRNVCQVFCRRLRNANNNVEALLAIEESR
jgi:CRP-like cAMP-binding protein